MYRILRWCCCPGWMGFFLSYFCVYFCIMFAPKQQTALGGEELPHVQILFYLSRLVTWPAFIIWQLRENCALCVWNPHHYISFYIYCSFILVPFGHLPPMRCLLARDPSVSRTTASSLHWLTKISRNAASHSLVSVSKVTSNLSTFKKNNSFSWCCWLDFLKAITFVARLLR